MSVGQITINPQIPYTNPNYGVPGLVQGFYLFALSIAGILAFGAMVYGGVKYTVGRGNPSSESEAKSWITGALLGLLLLGGAYVILQTVNPALTMLTMPNLPALSVPSTTVTNISQGTVASAGQYNCIPTSGGEGLYNGPGTPGQSNSWSPGLAKVLGCVQSAISSYGSAPYTTNAQHACNLSKTPPSVSCHFGGSCTDGGHAFDIDVTNNSLSLLQKAKTAALQCGQSTGQQVYCRCESQNGAQLDPGCTQSYDNHVHCNVDNASCSCN